MAGKQVTDEQWELMRAAFQEYGDKPYKVATVTGVNPRTAIKAWSIGWPDQHRLPICDVLKNEEIGARAKQLQALQSAERESAKAALITNEVRNEARAHATAIRQQEANIIQASRSRVAEALTRAENLSESALKYSEAVRSMFDLETQKARAWINYEVGVALGKIDPDDKTLLPKLKRPSLDPERGQRLLQQLNDQTASIVATFHEVMALERLYLGQPTDIIGVGVQHHLESTDIDLNQALARINAAQEAVQAVIQLKSGGNIIDVDPDDDSDSTELIGQPVAIE